MLYVIATPLGNLKDMSERAKEVLASVDCVFAEDTRVSRKLTRKRLETLNEHTSEARLRVYADLVAQGRTAALVTDAGTPGISDPGARFIDLLYAQGVRVIPIPGPSAVMCALSVSGFRAERFTFHGYPPVKKGRKTFFEKILSSEETQVFFSTPHKVLKDLEALSSLGQRRVFVGREMTKAFESYYRGGIEEVVAQVNKDPQKGEYTVVIDKA